MSKGEVLRGFVTERLAAASQEILAVVDRIVADYEEEASGFRQEIDRQRRQLEVLLQPRVALNEAGVKRSRSHGPGDEDEEDESTQHPENLEDLNNQTPPRCLPPRGQCEKRKPGRPQTSEPQDHVDLRIRILEDSQTDVVSNSVLTNSPLLKLRCPRGLREGDFLDLLRSSFPQLSGQNTLFDVLTSDKGRRLRPVKSLTPEEVRCPGKTTLFIRLQTHRGRQAGEHEIHPGQTEDHDAASLTCDETRRETSSRVQEVEASRVSFVSRSAASQRPHVEPEDAGEDRGTSERAEDLVESKEDESDDAEGGEANDGDWKPQKSDEELKDSDSELKSKSKKHRATETKMEDGDAALSCRVCAALHTSEVASVQHAWSHLDEPGSTCGVCGERPESAEALREHLQGRHLGVHVAAHSGGVGPRQSDVASLQDHQKLHQRLRCFPQTPAHRRTHSNTKTHLCGVCGKSLSDYRSLSRHKMTHSGERPHSCQVCGRRFKLPGTLRQHEKIHSDRERSYLCDVCCKMFLTSKQLQIHMRTHTNEKPYHCGECGKGFTTKGPLTIHMRVHTGETPYRCPDCGWSFKRKINLDNHVTVHSGLKPFVCSICGKACARKTYLTVHMRTHNGERPYKCSLCDKAFTQSHCLKTHMRSHQEAGAAT